MGRCVHGHCHILALPPVSPGAPNCHQLTWRSLLVHPGAFLGFLPHLALLIAAVGYHCQEVQCCLLPHAHFSPSFQPVTRPHWACCAVMHVLHVCYGCDCASPRPPRSRSVGGKLGRTSCHQHMSLYQHVVPESCIAMKPSFSPRPAITLQCKGPSPAGLPDQVCPRGCLACGRPSLN